jgi:hypothetical protein
VDVFSHGYQLCALQQRVFRLLFAACRLEESELENQCRVEQTHEEQVEQNAFDAMSIVEDLMCAATLDCLGALRLDCEELASRLSIEKGSWICLDAESDFFHLGSSKDNAPPLVNSVQAMEIELQTLRDLSSVLFSTARAGPSVANHRPSPVKRSLEMELMSAACEAPRQITSRKLGRLIDGVEAGHRFRRDSSTRTLLSPHPLFPSFSLED